MAQTVKLHRDQQTNQYYHFGQRHYAVLWCAKSDYGDKQWYCDIYLNDNMRTFCDHRQYDTLGAARSALAWLERRGD